MHLFDKKYTFNVYFCVRINTRVTSLYLILYQKESLMDFKDLSYILAIEKYGNISKAADAMYISQPSLSRFLQNVESLVGQPLFNRIGNKYVPTYVGERYIVRAREILNIKKELDQEVGDILQNNAGVLKVGFPAMRGTYMLPCTLPIFHSLYPRVKLVIQEASSSKLNELILNGDIDLAFYNQPDDNPNIETEIISHEEMVLVMSPDNPLCEFAYPMEGCRYPHLDLRHLVEKDQGVIMQNPNQRTRTIVDRLFKQHHITPNIILETSNIRAEAELASRNYGVCFITETHLKHMKLEKPLRYFSVGDPSTPINFVAAYRKNSYLPYHATEYIKIVRDFT